ncbi:PREDICTED: uncharacterized protein LOC109133316 [Camelina sativa]|uniref:Uncharacterized protein LOC109133316 n=1 Tax=Camelina sativa TaxID=90675 RepID=A0ABM1RS82_CAMSA|nr:PREDICTED: uncharacterized protein LOC109133316 [Camelina sativa]
MKDLRALKYFLGIEVTRRTDGIFLNQKKYALDILQETGLLNYQPEKFPMEQQHSLGRVNSPLLAEPARYRRLVGRLIYLLATRPDLTYSVHILSQFMQLPTHAHWDAALRVVRYLQGSPGQGILLSSDNDLQLTGWCDADWAGCPVNRRSLTGWFVSLGNSPLSWRSKKQNVVSMSSAEAEYHSMSLTLRELKWLKGLLEDLGVQQAQPIDLHCDSQAAIHIAANPVFHERTKHVELDFHNVRDAAKARLIRLHFVRSASQLADVFTKALGRRDFEGLIGKLGLHDPQSPT